MCAFFSLCVFYFSPTVSSLREHLMHNWSCHDVPKWYFHIFIKYCFVLSIFFMFAFGTLHRCITQNSQDFIYAGLSVDLWFKLCWVVPCWPWKKGGYYNIVYIMKEIFYLSYPIPFFLWPKRPLYRNSEFCRYRPKCITFC